MVVEILAPYTEWKQNFLAEIDALPHTSAKGDAFVQRILQIYYNLSEEDAVNATSSAGANDHGVDALYVVEEESSLHAFVVQGKYGSAGVGLDIDGEANKFISALRKAQGGEFVSQAIQTVAGVLRNDGIVRYIIATIEFA